MISLLQDVPIFAGVDDAALDLLMAHAQQQDYAAQAIIVREGELGNLLFVIGSGSVRVCKNFAQPGEVELVTLGPKSFFGEMCILEAMPRSATVQAVAASRLFSLPAGAFHHLYKAMPAQYSILLLNIARDLSRRLRRLDEMFAARH
jgi:CRP/FNR family transcriptional regulator, cyclic AMP receptor protein